MNARQARSLLELIADLYTLAQTPEELPPMMPPMPNGKTTEPEPAGAKK